MRHHLAEDSYGAARVPLEDTPQSLDTRGEPLEIRHDHRTQAGAERGVLPSEDIGCRGPFRFGEGQNQVARGSSLAQSRLGDREPERKE